MQSFLFHPLLFLKRLGIAFLVYTIARLLFLVFNYSYFSDLSPLLFFYALRFDLCAITFLFFPFILLSVIPFHLKSGRLYQKLLSFFFHLSNILSLTLNCIDIEYFKFTLKRTTSDIFSLIGFGEDFVSLLPQFAVDFWYVIVIWLAITAFSVFLYRKTFPENKQGLPSNTDSGSDLPVRARLWKSYLFETLVFSVFLVVFIIGSRGGLQLRPINIINANAFTSPQNIPLVLNTPFTIIKTMNEEVIAEREYFQSDKLDSLYSPIHQFSKKEGFPGLNVVIIILESFSNEYIGVMDPEIERETYTPFLDSLAGQSLVFDRCFANGKKSIEGIPAIVSALPTLMNNPFISSPYSANKINSLANILKKEGYQTGFFHGGTNGTMGFDAFSQAAGFDKYYGRYEFNNDSEYDGHWGIYDEEFFQYFCRNLSGFREPFLGCIFSLSSHHPFTIPEKYGSLFNEGKLKIHKSIQYTDFSLKRFFEAASKSQWFKNTLFIITADHTSTTTLPFYNSTSGIYSIPLLFYSPGRINPGTDHRTTQQTDILPSALHLLNYPEKFVAFGQSVFGEREPGFAISFMNNIYQIITEKNVIQFDGEEIIGTYHFVNGQLEKSNILANDSPDTEQTLNKLKAIIQSYNYRLIKNKLVEQ